MKRQEIHFAEVDWADLQARLILYARRRFFVVGLARDEVIRGFGDSHDDLAHDLLVRFIDPDDKTVEWQPRHGKATTLGVFKLLCAALRNDLRDRVKAKRTKDRTDALIWETRDTRQGSSLNKPYPSQLGDQGDQEDQQVTRINCKRIMDCLFADLDSDPDDDVESYALLQFDDHSNFAGYKPQRVAQELNWTVERVNTVKKKFGRRLDRLSQCLETDDHRKERRHVQKKSS